LGVDSSQLTHQAFQACSSLDNVRHSSSIAHSISSSSSTASRAGWPGSNLSGSNTQANFTSQAGHDSDGGGGSNSNSNNSYSSSKAASLKRTEDIRSAANPEQLLQALQQHAASLDAFNINAAFSTAAKLRHGRILHGRSPGPAVRALLSTLLQCADRLQDTTAFVPASQLAAVIYACGQMKLPESIEQLLPQLLQQDRLRHANTRHISNVMHAVAKSGAALTEPQQQQLLDAFCAQVSAANAQDVSNLLWALAVTQKHVSADHLQQLAERSGQVLCCASAQAVSTSFWALTKLQHAVSQEHVDQHMARFLQLVSSASAQDISNMLTAVASTGHFLQPQDLHAILQAFVQILHTASAQSVKDVLAAVATMGQQMRPRQLQACLGRFARLAPHAAPQGISMVLWALAKLRAGSSCGTVYLLGDSGAQGEHDAQLRMLEEDLVRPGCQPALQDYARALRACAELRYLPQQLLTAVEQRGVSMLGAGQGDAGACSADVKSLASMGYACAQFGHYSELLPRQLLVLAASQLATGGQDSVGDSVIDSNARGLVNLCWAAAVLDAQDCAPFVLQLVAACRDAWHTMGSVDYMQLFQVHLWLQDCAGAHATAEGLQDSARAYAEGLQAVLSAQQLEQCRSSWQQQLKHQDSKSGPSKAQLAVFEALQQLPREQWAWQEQPALGQYTADRHYGIDIAAVTSTGKQLAIEVDGPWHFLQPGNRLEGPTLARNRALAVRGWVVVSVPYFEWRQCKTWEQQQEYLLAKLQAVQ
jgi:hypothetical protein